MKPLWIFTIAVSALLLQFSLQTDAQERLFAKADTLAGKALHTENNCSACHQQRTGLNEKDFYTRPDRKVKTQEKLISQIEVCNSQLNSGFFPEDELNIAAFLNDAYYHLK